MLKTRPLFWARRHLEVATEGGTGMIFTKPADNIVYLHNSFKIVQSMQQGLCHYLIRDTIYQLMAAHLAGDTMASALLGAMYWQGDGVPRDEAEALKMLEHVRDVGDTAAEAQLRHMFSQGGTLAAGRRLITLGTVRWWVFGTSERFYGFRT